MHSYGKTQTHSQRRQKDNFIASCYTTNLADCGSICCSFRIKLCNDTGSPKRGYRNADCLRSCRTTHIGDTCWRNYSMGEWEKYINFSELFFFPYT
jgi:Fe2+-dicitrate sensor, membrane component